MKSGFQSTLVRGLRFIGLFLGLFVFGLGLFVEAQVPPTIQINPGEASIQQGEQIDLLVELNGASNVYGVQFDLIFNPTVLSVVDANPAVPGLQISLGSCPAPDYVILNGVDTSNGEVKFAVTQMRPTTVCDGGSVATTRFECLVSGRSSTIVFSGPLVSDPDGKPIPLIVQSGLIHCVGPVFLPLINNGME